ncbi:MAG: iron transporter [Pararobbsia sp.]
MKLKTNQTGLAGAIVACAFALASFNVSAAEYPIAKHTIEGGMEIGAVYLQPITMDPEGMMRKATDSDIHLEADIHAVKDNPTGFAEGDWMPYLQVRYELSKVGTTEMVKGDLMAMVANDGPHYGDNVKLFGPGKYHLKLIVEPPMQTGHMAFGRHVDKETGVGPWFKPITLEYDFPFAGIGKKGGY